MKLALSIALLLAAAATIITTALPNGPPVSMFL